MGLHARRRFYTTEITRPAARGYRPRPESSAAGAPHGAWAERARFDWPTLAAALAIAVGGVLAVVLVPSVARWRGDLRGALSRARTGGIQGRGGRVERGLVVAEVALAMLFAPGAALSAVGLVAAFVPARRPRRIPPACPPVSDALSPHAPLGVLEEQIVVAVLRARGDAYGMEVRREIERATGRELAVGAVYAALDRLEAKGLLGSRRALADGRTMRERLWQGVDLGGLLALARA